MDELIYKRNINTLKKRYPEYSDALSLSEVNDRVSCNIVDIGQKKILTAHTDGREYQLESIYSNDHILNSFVSMINFAVYELNIFLFGFGNGMYIRRILEEGTEQNTIRIFVYEPDLTIFNECIKNFDISALIDNENVFLIFPQYSEKNLKRYFIDYVKCSTVRQLHMGYYPNYFHIYKEEGEKFKKEIEGMMERLNVSKNALDSYGEIYYKNTLSNYREFINSFSLSSLKSVLPTDVPAIIVASGPSLSKNIDQLKMAANRSFLLAVDSSLGALDKAGIIPDMYVTIDPYKHISNFTISSMNDVPVVGDITCPDYVFKNNSFSFFTFVFDSYILRYLIENKADYGRWDISAGGSVANVAMKFAALLGFKTIILVGQDLAYTGNRAHAMNVVYDDDDMTEPKVETIDVYGEPIISSKTFMLYKKWYEDFIEVNPEIKVIDATEGGAYIEGTEVLTLKDAINEFCIKEVNIRECINKCEPLFDATEKAEFYLWLKKFPEYMNSIVSDLREMHNNYDKIEQLVLRGKENLSEIDRLLKVNDSISERADNNPVRCYIDYINTKSIQNIERNVNEVNMDIKKDVLDMCRLGRSHIEAMIETAEIINNDYEKWGLHNERY